MSTSGASTGRVDVHAVHGGLFVFDRDVVLAANTLHEGITVATVAEDQVVKPHRRLATIKIIPFAVPAAAVAALMALVRTRWYVAPVFSRRAVLVQTLLPHVSTRTLDKTRRVVEERLRARDTTPVEELRCAHDTRALEPVLRGAVAANADWILVVGASAIVDRQDVLPTALERLGGTVLRFGMAVDPGNVLLLGELDGRTVLVLPGCARSPRPNGVDFVLDRLACNVPLDDSWWTALAVGGVLDVAAAW